jgi:hypothetical protein
VAVFPGRIARVVCATVLLIAGFTRAGNELRRGPYLQNQTDTSVTVLWATSGRGGTGSVEVETIGSFTAESVGDLDSITRHRARVHGLAPGGDYRYRILTDGVIQSEWIPFRSNKPRRNPIRFIITGDSGDAIDQSHQRNVARQMLQASPDFWLHVGDMVYSNYSETDFEYNTSKHFGIYQELNRSRPHYVTRGNHESTGIQFRKDFDFPRSTAQVPEVYDFTYGDLWIASLSTGHRGDFRDPADDSDGLYKGKWQHAWLQQRLQTAARSHPWKLVFFHRPTYNSAVRYSEFMVAGTKDIVELCEDQGVDFIAFGHVHSLQRSKPVRRGQAVDAANGVVHLESGAGGGLNIAGPGKKESFHTDFIEGTRYGFLQLDISYAPGSTTCTLTFFDEFGTELNRWSKSKPLGSP